jgi:hypothetical protein
MTINELQEFYDTLSEADDNKGKYGRNRLFNSKAMLQIVTDVNFLKNIYEKIKTRGKDVFGYHFNEIILSMLFLKYVRSNKVLFERYLKLRKYYLHKNKKNLEDKKLEKAKERLAIDQSKEVAQTVKAETPEKQAVNETDTSAVDNFPSGPASFAKDVKNWRKFASPIIKAVGATVVNTPLINNKTKFLTQLSEDIIPGETEQGIPNNILIIQSNDAPDAITFDDIKIELINGIQPEIALHELMKGGTLNVLFSLFNKTSETYILIVDADDYINFVCTKVNSLQDELDMETILRTIKQNYDIFEQTLKLYVISEIDDSLEASDENDDLIDYTNKLQPKTINTSVDNTQPLETNNQTIITGNTETQPNITNNQTNPTGDTQTTNNMINEVAVPIVTQQINKINKENEKSLANDIKSLNSQIANYFKDKQEEPTPFEYDYDGDNAKDNPKELVQFVPSKEQNDLTTNDSGRGLEDLDYSYEPSPAYWDRLKQGIGEEKFSKLKDKAKAREMERKSMRDVETQINDFSKTPTIKDKLTGLNESITSSYYDINNRHNFVTIKTNSLTEATKEDTEKPGVYKLNYKGLGSLLESKTNSIKADLNETLNNFDFFYNKKEDKVVYVIKESTQLVDKDTIKKMKKLVNYDPSKYVSNKLNNRPKF